jgi:hypothetical protein
LVGVGDFLLTRPTPLSLFFSKVGVGDFAWPSSNTTTTTIDTDNDTRRNNNLEAREDVENEDKEENEALSLAMNRAHFSLWCVTSAPLIAGADLRTLAPQLLGVLTNPAAVAVNQGYLLVPTLPTLADSSSDDDDNDDDDETDDGQDEKSSSSIHNNSNSGGGSSGGSNAGDALGFANGSSVSPAGLPEDADLWVKPLPGNQVVSESS